MRVRIASFIGASLVVLTTCDLGSDTVCGDGLVALDEACDDNNLQDGDGCSSTCEVEVPSPGLELSCVDLLESAKITQNSMIATTDGHVIVSGRIQATGSSAWQGWVGAFDQQGQQLWSIEYDDPNTSNHRIRAKGSGFVFIQSNTTAWTAVEIDGAGNTIATTALDPFGPGAVTPIDLLDTPAGLLLGGATDADMWVGRVGADGGFENLMVEDFAGLDDRIIELRPSASGFVALAGVSTLDNGMGDSVGFDTEDALLLEFDAEGQEQRRTQLTSGDPAVSFSGAALVPGADGTWYVGATLWSVDSSPQSVDRATMAAVRDGEILWQRSYDGAGASDPAPVKVHAFDAVGSSDLVLVGRVAFEQGGFRSYLAQINPDDGSLIAEQLGEELVDGSSYYVGAEQTPDARAWLLGVDSHADRGVQWLCDTKL